MPRIIDSVLVYDDSPDQSTELDQRVPVAAVTGQPRRLDREHGADAALADRRQQALEARRSEEHTSELQSHSDLVCRLLLEKKKTTLQNRAISILRLVRALCHARVQSLLNSLSIK